ncbi:MAG TPA: hypothetical protein VHY83_05595 [Solirubrobacteraceae bacterium]|jgi:hypothetical protein|nr:hypothetical protein [Solirubrobacteraceae bacterium]
MTTRSITTSQPDVACEVCERRLLRGEQHDVFLVAGRRRTVCELCAPRAVQEGWRREADGDALTLAPPRPRRGRSFFDRLPVRFRTRPSDATGEGAGELDADELLYPPEHTRAREPTPASEPPPAGEPAQAGEPHPAPYERLAPEPGREDPHPYDFLDGLEMVDSRPGEAGEQSLAGFPPRAAARSTVADRGIEVFNASEFPRRIAGIARSLGPPAVNVCQVEDTVGESVSIVVAWELCWYRYEIDLDAPAPAARLAAQGTELEELGRSERQANTHVDELGLLDAA